MEHKKRGLALLLALTLPLLCGCEGMVSERPMEDLSGWTIETGADVPTQDAFAAETQMATLYLLSADGDRLVPVPAEVTMRDGESLAQAALTALLDGAKLGRTDATWPMNGEGKAPTLSVSDGIATVNPVSYTHLWCSGFRRVRRTGWRSGCSTSSRAFAPSDSSNRQSSRRCRRETPQWRWRPRCPNEST